MKMDAFERLLSVWMEDIEFSLNGHGDLPWSDFFLNPRRLRGSDFLMRWSQGVWSENRIVEAVKSTGRFFAMPYGPSGIAPTEDPRQFELYFERLESAGLGKMKRPDLLIFDRENEERVNSLVNELGGLAELPFTREDAQNMKELLSLAVIAVECENSLWRAKKMPDFETGLSPQRRLGGKMGLRKAAVLPTIIVKEEDRIPLARWQETCNVPIHIWHVFYDVAYGIRLATIERLIHEELILPTEQVFQAPGGPTTGKIIYKIYYHYGYDLALASEEPRLVADFIEDKNGHILPYVHFEGGRLILSDSALDVISECSDGRRL